ncbi:hypothetical protein B7494_g8303 [Chlorociboria aeruginascens]|nr:hypothetical protein B7494_g8303 [Chlorociboria aeruginascens]
MASTRAMSPGGSFLRASRVFAIPAPLRTPPNTYASVATWNSDTATTPHPVHLSITTPQSSLAKGDWGFKRSLPLRSTTKTSTPIIRIAAIDTIEHFTDFASAADHTLSLQKWHEMNIPLSTPGDKDIRGYPTTNIYSNKAAGSGKSVFEDALDSTVKVERGGTLERDDVRWKFSGPWLAGQTEGDFNTYVQKEVRRRKPEFQKFLRKACAEAFTLDAIRTARDRGVEVGPPIKAADITEQQFNTYIKSLREDKLENGELYKQIRKFLDLPPPPRNKAEHDVNMALGTSGRATKMEIKSDDYKVSDSPYAQNGPPKTHPSAGLAYSRSSSYLFNHPTYGPQKTHPPVHARIVLPKGAAVGNFNAALGVGGFVTEVPEGFQPSFGANIKRRRGVIPSLPGLANIELDKVGGSKAYVQPTSASIDSKGRVALKVTVADPEAISVLEGTVDQIPVDQQRARVDSSLTSSTRPTKRVNSGSKGYGVDGFFRKEGSNDWPF